MAIENGLISINYVLSKIQLFNRHFFFLYIYTKVWLLTIKEFFLVSNEDFEFYKKNRVILKKWELLKLGSKLKNKERRYKYDYVYKLNSLFKKVFKNN